MFVVGFVVVFGSVCDVGVLCRILRFRIYCFDKDFYLMLISYKLH